MTISDQDVPTKFGVLLYPGFEVLDVFGPLEALNVISREAFDDLVTESEKKSGKVLTYIKDLNLTVVTTEKTLEPVTAVAPDKIPDPFGIGSSKAPTFVPHCTINDVPEDLEVLIIPGGLGSDAVGPDVIKWIGQITPKLRYLFTVCTGSDIAARAGVLNGLKATTNKQAWHHVTTKPSSHATYWVAHARWVRGSDKIWTTAGVSAGTDGFIAWIKEVYGEGYGDKACQWMEYWAETTAEPDHFSAGLNDVPPTSLKRGYDESEDIPA